MAVLRCEAEILERILALPLDMKIVDATYHAGLIDFELEGPGIAETGFIEATFYIHNCAGESWGKAEVKVIGGER